MAPAFLGDTWEFDGVNWQQRFPVHAPSARCRAAFAYSPLLNRCVLFGGGTVDGGSSFGDCWTWDGADWQSIVAAGTAPAPRQGAALVFEPTNQRLLLFGGRAAAGTVFGDTWSLDLQVSPASYTTFGAGCPGPTSQVPVLAAAPNELPVLGTTSHLLVSNLPVALTLPVFVLGTSNVYEPNPGYPLPIDLGFVGWPGCPQLVSHDVLDAVPTLTGTASIPFTVPLNATFLGFAFHAQALVLYQPSGAAVSNGLTGVVGF